MKRVFLLLTLLAFLARTGGATPPVEPGLYAVFDTNHGAFTCSLFFEEVPMTVANFVGLAEGSRPWIDLETGRLRTDPFYNGLTFHRVIDNFMIQGGSRNGQGTDGPGYRFPDEFVPGLVHAKAGILSMANSGFDTNGSQFFVTEVPTNHLNYKHAVFGEVIEGFEVVETISAQATDSANRPLAPVVLHSVQIHRIGDAALAFDVDAHGLPKINNLLPTLTATAHSFALQFPRHENRDYTLSYSKDLQVWLPGTLQPTGEIPGTGSYDLAPLAGDLDRQFYHLTETDYSEVDYGFLPENLVGKTLQLNLSTNNVFVLHIDEERSDENTGEPLGTGSFDGGEEVPLKDYLFYDQNNRGRFLFILEGFAQINTDLKFIGEESGTFTGRVLSTNPFDVHGTFTLVPQ